MRAAAFLFLFSLLAIDSAGQCPDNLFVNGDLNGIEGEATAATNWSIAEGTPDLNDHIGPLNSTPDYAWYIQPIASPTGGTWQNIGPPEAISQMVSTTIGATYFICLDYAWQPILNVPAEYPFLGPFGVDVYANGMHIFSAPFAAVYGQWYSACTSFVANATSTTIMFHGADAEEAYGAIDNLCMYSQGKTEITEQQTPFSQLFPNPATDVVHAVIARTIHSARAICTSGQSVSLPVKGNEIFTSKLLPGLYILEVSFAGDSGPLRQRIQIQRSE